MFFLVKYTSTLLTSGAFPQRPSHAMLTKVSARWPIGKRTTPHSEGKRSARLAMLVPSSLQATTLIPLLSTFQYLVHTRN